MTNDNHWSDELKRLKACPDAIEWARKCESIEAAWSACERGDWMLWYAGRISGPPESDSRKRLVRCACACARLSLPYVMPGDERPLRAIETAERWVNGDDSVTLDDVRTAAWAAGTTAWAAAGTVWAAGATAWAAAGTAWAAGAAAWAAWAAACADAGVATRKQCPAIVRQHYPSPPVPHE